MIEAWFFGTDRWVGHRRILHHGDYKEGMFDSKRQARLHGFGIRRYSDGNLYTGLWQRDIKHG